MYLCTYICLYLYLSAYLVYKYMCVYELCIWYAVYIIYVGINGPFTLYICICTHMYTIIFTILCTHCIYIYMYCIYIYGIYIHSIYIYMVFIHIVFIYIHYTHYLLAAVYSLSHLLYYI